MTEQTARPAVVVGTDGSAESCRAVAFAASEATLRGAPLSIVHAFVWPYYRVRLGPPEYGPADGGLHAAAERILTDATTVALDVAPEVSVATALVTGAPAQVLLEAAQEAELLVVGNRGLGGFTGLLVGSVGVQMAAHAACPVVVVREPASATPGQGVRPVVVGVDESPVSGPAVEFAFREADLRGTDLVAVRAWTRPRTTRPGDRVPVGYDREAMHRAEARALSEALAGYRQRHPGVSVVEKVVRGHAGRILVDASAGAELLVVGSRGRGGFRGLLLGSVSQAAIHHAHCSVAVVHPRG